MSPLRTRMIEDMILAGLAAGTQPLYVQAVCQLAAHYRRSPDQLSEEEVRAYLLDLRQNGAARSTFKISQYGLRFLYHHTLGRGWGLFGEKRSPPRGRSGCLRLCPMIRSLLDYLARYVFRVALTNARIVGLDDNGVTIQYKDRKA